MVIRPDVQKDLVYDLWPLGGWAALPVGQVWGVRAAEDDHQ